MAKISIEQLTKQFDELVKIQAKFIDQAKQLQTIQTSTKGTGPDLKNTITNTEKLKTSTANLNNIEKNLLGTKQALKIAQRDANKLQRQQLEIEQLRTKSGQKLNQQLKDQQSELKKLKGAGNGLVTQIRNMALAYLGLQAAMRFIKNTVKIIVEFQKAQSTLLAISGKTRKELEGLTKQAKLLGGATEFTATQVTGLQIELAKLGFTVDEIALSTKDILNFASATGANLADAASTAGIALRAFGLDASKMNEVVSTLAVATTKSALTFEDYKTILSTSGPVAKAYGFTLQDLIAFQGKLADSGFDASKASTAFRNILLNLADTNGKLAKEIGHNVTNSDELVEALIELRAKGINLNDTLQLTDKRSVAAFNTFLNTAEGARDLRDGITGVNAQLQEMVDKKLDNLAGDVTKLSSAWEVFILKGEGGVNAFRYIIQFLNDVVIQLANLDLIFTKSSKLTEDQIERSFDVMLALTGKKYKEFQELVKFSDNIVFESVKTQGQGFEDQLKKVGFTAEEAVKLWDEYLKRREEQNNIEQKAVQDAADKKIEEEKRSADYANKHRNDLSEKDKKRIAEESAAKNAYYDELNELNIENALREEKIGQEIHDNLLSRLNEEKKTREEMEAESLRIKQESADKAAEIEKNRLEEQLKAEEQLRDIKIQSALSVGDFLSVLLDNQLTELEDKNKQGLLSDEQYAKEAAKIRRKQAILNKADALFQIGLNTAIGAANAASKVVTLPLVPFIVALGALQAAAVIAKKIPEFAKGVIGYKGEGTETSDSNLVAISTGESVITAKGTKKRKNLLHAVNSDLSDAEIFNAMLKDTHEPLNNIVTDDRLLYAMVENNRLTKKLIELQAGEKEYYIPGFKVKKTKYGEIRTKIGKG